MVHDLDWYHELSSKKGRATLCVCVTRHGSSLLNSAQAPGASLLLQNYRLEILTQGLVSQKK